MPGTTRTCSSPSNRKIGQIRSRNAAAKTRNPNEVRGATRLPASATPKCPMNMATNYHVLPGRERNREIHFSPKNDDQRGRRGAQSTLVIFSIVLMHVEIRPLVLLPKRLASTDGGFMKFASFPKFAFLLPIAGILTMALAGCGATSNLGLTQGNWAFSASSTAPGKVVSGPTFVVGGNLTQSGNSLTGTMYITQSGCIPPQFVGFTGTVKDKNVTLTSASFGGQVISVTASGTKDSLTGTYTVTGECADSGSVDANAVPSISGTWSGTVLVNTSPATMSVVLTQASTASADGT